MECCPRWIPGLPGQPRPGGGLKQPLGRSLAGTSIQGGSKTDRWAEYPNEGKSVFAFAAYVYVSSQMDARVTFPEVQNNPIWVLLILSQFCFFCKLPGSPLQSGVPFSLFSSAILDDVQVEYAIGLAREIRKYIWWNQNLGVEQLSDADRR